MSVPVSVAKLLSTFSKRTELSTRLPTINVEKNCKQRLIHSLPTTSGAQTLSKL